FGGGGQDDDIRDERRTAVRPRGAARDPRRYIEAEETLAQPGIADDERQLASGDAARPQPLDRLGRYIYEPKEHGGSGMFATTLRLVGLLPSCILHRQVAHDFPGLRSGERGRTAGGEAEEDLLDFVGRQTSTKVVPGDSGCDLVPLRDGSALQ